MEGLRRLEMAKYNQQGGTGHYTGLLFYLVSIVNRFLLASCSHGMWQTCSSSCTESFAGRPHTHVVVKLVRPRSQLQRHRDLRVCLYVVFAKHQSYRGADKSLARPDWKEGQLKGRHFSSDAEFVAAAETLSDGRPSELFLSGLQKLESGCCSLFASWLG
jgi:hypothetical protein